jgi:hypothetical protein
MKIKPNTAVLVIYLIFEAVVPRGCAGNGVRCACDGWGDEAEDTDIIQLFPSNTTTIILPH